MRKLSSSRALLCHDSPRDSRREWPIGHGFNDVMAREFVRPSDVSIRRLIRGRNRLVQLRPASLINLRSLIRLTLVAVVAGAILWFAAHNASFQPTALERALKSFGRWSPLPFILVYAFGTVLFLPGSVLTVAGGALFGAFWGTVWNLIGASLGAIIAFAIARYLASDWVARSAGERLQGLAKGVEQEGWRFVAFVRLVPLFPFNLVNYAFGLTRIGLVEYAIASMVCMTPGAVAYTYLGYAGLQAASGQAGAIRKGLFALALLAAVAYVPRLAHRLKGERYADAANH